MERDYVAGLYARLISCGQEKRVQLAQVRRAGAVDTMQNVSERDAFAALYEDHLAQLDAVEDRLCFGRLDLTRGAARYVGRIGLTNEDRAAAARLARAGGRPVLPGHRRRPEGVRSRRHLILQGREVNGIEDEVLDLPRSPARDRDVVQGEGALLLPSTPSAPAGCATSSPPSRPSRTGSSGRRIAGALVVQGGPGTGKTAVALHRAAYLLYAHRDRLSSPACWWSGRRRVPALHRAGAALARRDRRGAWQTLGQLLPGVDARRRADRAVAAIKGDLGMAGWSPRGAQPSAGARRGPSLEVDGTHAGAGRASRAGAPTRPARQAAQRGPGPFVDDLLSELDRAAGRAGEAGDHRRRGRPRRLRRRVRASPATCGVR